MVRTRLRNLLISALMVVGGNTLAATASVSAAESMSVILNVESNLSATVSTAAPSASSENWGTVAVKQTIAKYGADVIDYRYDGRFPLQHSEVEERFRLWLRKDGREFGVNVHIKVDAVSNRLISITWEQV